MDAAVGWVLFYLPLNVCLNHCIGIELATKFPKEIVSAWGSGFQETGASPYLLSWWLCNVFFLGKRQTSLLSQAPEGIINFHREKPGFALITVFCICTLHILVSKAMDLLEVRQGSCSQLFKLLLCVFLCVRARVTPSYNLSHADSSRHCKGGWLQYVNCLQAQTLVMWPRLSRSWSVLTNFASRDPRRLSSKCYPSSSPGKQVQNHSFHSSSTVDDCSPLKMNGAFCSLANLFWHAFCTGSVECLMPGLWIWCKTVLLEMVHCDCHTAFWLHTTCLGMKLGHVGQLLRLDICIIVSCSCKLEVKCICTFRRAALFWTVKHACEDIQILMSSRIEVELADAGVKEAVLGAIDELCIGDLSSKDSAKRLMELLQGSTLGKNYRAWTFIQPFHTFSCTATDWWILTCKEKFLFSLQESLHDSRSFELRACYDSIWLSHTFSISSFTWSSRQLALYMMREYDVSCTAILSVPVAIHHDKFNMKHLDLTSSSLDVLDGSHTQSRVGSLKWAVFEKCDD